MSDLTVFASFVLDCVPKGEVPTQKNIRIQNGIAARRNREVAALAAQATTTTTALAPGASVSETDQPTANANTAAGAAGVTTTTAAATTTPTTTVAAEPEATSNDDAEAAERARQAAEAEAELLRELMGFEAQVNSGEDSSSASASPTASGSHPNSGFNSPESSDHGSPDQSFIARHALGAVEIEPSNAAQLPPPPGYAEAISAPTSPSSPQRSQGFGGQSPSGHDQDMLDDLPVAQVASLQAAFETPDAHVIACSPNGTPLPSPQHTHRSRSASEDEEGNGQADEAHSFIRLNDDDNATATFLEQLVACARINRDENSCVHAHVHVHIPLCLAV